MSLRGDLREETKWAFWASKQVVVTGGAAFLGSYVVEKLRERGCQRIFVPRRVDFDPWEKEAMLRLFQQTKPDMVIHLAAVVGGIGANRRYPGLFFFDNSIMGIQLLEYARGFDVKISTHKENHGLGKKKCTRDRWGVLHRLCSRRRAG